MAREPKPLSGRLRRARSFQTIGSLGFAAALCAAPAHAEPPGARLGIDRLIATSTAVGAHPDVESELFGAPAPSPEPRDGVEPEVPSGRDAVPDGAEPEVPPGRDAVESELFGGPASPTPDASPGPETSLPLGMERAAPSELLDDLRAGLEAASDRLALGGNLFLRLEYRALAEGGAETFALVSPSTLDLYLDARPVERVRTYVRARLAYDATVAASDGAAAPNLADPTNVPDASALGGGGNRSRTDVFLDQLWLKFDLAQRVFLTVGKQRVRWGTGRIWNPTDFLNAQRFDPLALFDPRLGVGLLKVHVPIEELGANLYAIANLDGADRADRVGAAARAEIAFGQTEVAVSGSWRKDEPVRWGADVSTGLGPFELRLEAGFLYDVVAPFFGGQWSADEPLALGSVTTTYRQDDVIPQVVAGADLTLDYGDGDQAIIGLEYFFNDAGYDGAELYPLLLLVPGLARSTAPVIGDIEVGELLVQQLNLTGPPPGLFQPLYLGRHYLSAFALFPTPFGLEDHTFTVTAIANLSDRSAVGRIDHSLRLFRFLSLRSYVNVHFGDRGEFRLGLDVGPLPIPGAPDEGISISPPAFEVGVALNAVL